MSAFDVMLHQCEKQAEKLCSINIDDNYVVEIDIFSSYFSQLQQVIDNENPINAEDKVSNLLNMLNTIIARVQENQISLANQIDGMKKNKNIVGYGSVKQFAHRINRRY